MVVEGLYISLTLNQHLNNNNSNKRTCCLTKLNWKPLSKNIKSLTILNIGIQKPFVEDIKTSPVYYINWKSCHM